jgi:hypothetical protein
MWMDFIKPIINTIILWLICRDFVLLFSLNFLFVCVFICVLLIISVYFSSGFACYFSFIIFSFLHHIIIPIALCIYSLFLFIYLFPSFYFLFLLFFSWWTRLTCVLTVFSSNLRQDSVYFTFWRSRWLHEWFCGFTFQYNHGCSPVFALQRLIQDLQIPKACFNENLD